MSQPAVSMTLDPRAREFYRVALYADPVVAGWDASFDAGTTWIAGVQSGTAPVTLPSGVTVTAPVWQWLVRGTAYAVGDGTASALVSASVRPLLRYTDAPEQGVRKGPQIIVSST